MTIDTGSRGLRFVPGDTGVRPVDVRCGGCAACAADRDYWCLEARETGGVLADVSGVQDAALVRRWTSALAALSVARSRPSAALLVLGDVDPEAVTDLVAPWAQGPVLVAADGRDPEMRRRLAEVSVTGRAPVVLTVTDVRAAVRAVERGGQVCGPDGGARLPTVTELVQRDVTLLAARGVDGLVTDSSWPLLAARLSAVLGAPDLAQASR
jgi:hypothetical protein